MDCIFAIANLAFNQNFIDEAENNTNLIDGKTLMDKNQFVNIHTDKLIQVEEKLESVRSCNMERKDGKIISMNIIRFEKNCFVEQIIVLEIIFFYLLSEIYKFYKKLILIIQPQ
jgi:hypothetical protein